MRRLKLSVVLLFSVAFIFFGQQWFKTASAGKDSVRLGSISAPTGVSASNGDYIDKVNVMWNTVRGATIYRVFRNTSNDSSTSVDVGTTAANYFFDTTAQTGQNYFYWVRAENAGENSDLSGGVNGLRVAGSFHSQFFVSPHQQEFVRHVFLLIQHFSNQKYLLSFP